MTPISFSFNPDHDALFLDVDGTLLEIAATPVSVVVPDGLIATLYRLHQKTNGALALISGRALKDVDNLLKAQGLPVAGSHGAEWRTEPHGAVSHAPPMPTAFLESVKNAFEKMDGVIVEDKTYSVAVHYRLALHHQPAIEKKIYELVSYYAGKMIIIHGKMVFEVVHPEHSKGTAIERLMQHAPFAGRNPVFLGDDETDIAAIGACMKMGGLAARVGVQPPFKSIFPSPEAVRDWLILQAA